MGMKIMQLSIVFYCLTAVTQAFLTEGKTTTPDGTWDRPFPAINITISDYVKQLVWKIGNKTSANNLYFEPTDFAFQVDASLLGVNLEGTVEFANGISISQGKFIMADFASWGYRSDDRKSATVQLAIRLDVLNTRHELKTVLIKNNAEGMVETTLKNIDFIFDIKHTFETSENTVLAVSFAINESDATYNIKPRTAVTYAIETLSKRDDKASVWYREGITQWQKNTLAPLLLQQAQGLTFPISPD